MCSSTLVFIASFPHMFVWMQGLDDVGVPEEYTADLLAEDTAHEYCLIKEWISWPSRHGGTITQPLQKCMSSRPICSGTNITCTSCCDVYSTADWPAPYTLSPLSPGKTSVQTGYMRPAHMRPALTLFPFPNQLPGPLLAIRHLPAWGSNSAWPGAADCADSLPHAGRFGSA